MAKRGYSTKELADVNKAKDDEEGVDVGIEWVVANRMFRFARTSPSYTSQAPRPRALRNESSQFSCVCCTVCNNEFKL